MTSNPLTNRTAIEGYQSLKGNLSANSNIHLENQAVTPMETEDMKID
jgi:hypothetical protein